MTKWDKLEKRISIHAHAKGATLPQYMAPWFHIHFNPRSREGSDYISNTSSMLILLFQSTLPRRERHYKHLQFGFTCNFNPRSREGSDSPRARRSISTTNFNPRSREGSDEFICIFKESLHISIHAPAKGATLSVMCNIFYSSISIHAPAKGATSDSTPMFFTVTDFNPRSREGSDEIKE